MTGKDEDQLCEIEIRELVVLFRVRGEDVVAKADIERETRGSLPVVLKEAGVLHVGDVVRDYQEIAASKVGETQQNGCQTGASDGCCPAVGEVVVESEPTSRGRVRER